jgi:hypothetical protein
VQRLLAEVEPDPDLRDVLYQEVVVDTYQLICARWGDLLRLASVLVSRETLSGDEVTRVLEGGPHMDQNGYGHLTRAELCEPLLVGEVVRNFNQSGVWLGAERDAWMRSVGLLTEGENDGDEGYEDEAE